MDRMVKCTFNGREIYLNYSVGVMFEVIEKYGDVSTALTYMQEDTKGGFEVTKHLGLLRRRTANSRADISVTTRRLCWKRANLTFISTRLTTKHSRLPWYTQ